MIHAIATKDIFVDFRYKVCVDAQFGTVDMRGAHAINDGGYHEWVHTIAGSKEGTSTTVDEESWGSSMESVRKDSERCFGVMKKGFLILHVKSNLHRARHIDTILKVFYCRLSTAAIISLSLQLLRCCCFYFCFNNCCGVWCCPCYCFCLIL